MLPLVMTVAIVVGDHAALRAAPHDTAARQAAIWSGDWLEVRGERTGFLQVYDHRHERPGYIRREEVRTYALDESSAPRLRAVVEFLRDTPGAESLGIGYVALYLKAAPPDQVGSEVFDALGTLADRLARRASTGSDRGAALSGHLDVASSYGVHFASIELGDRGAGEAEHVILCYDGEAFRRVLAMRSPPVERAWAALALTRAECSPPGMTRIEARAQSEWHLDVLEHADPASVPVHVANRLRLRRAAVLSELSWLDVRHGDAHRAAAEAERAMRELVLVDRTQLADEDGTAYDETAIRVAAGRWPAASSAAVDGRAPHRNGVELRVREAQPGQSCLGVVERGKVSVEKCTYGVAWTASTRWSPRGDAATIAVQQLAGWVELWVAHVVGGGWQIDALDPATVDPDVGYVEAAGWSPDGARLLVAREAFYGGGAHREFQVLRSDTLAIERHAHTPDVLLAFRRYAAPDWHARTLAVR